MTVVDAAAAFQEGAVPTNDQLVAFLTRMQAALPPQDKLSKAGSGLVFDTKTLLEVACTIVQDRNGTEELQEFLWRTRGAAGQLGKDGLKFTWGKGAKNGKVRTAKSKNKQKGGIKDKAQEAATTVKTDTVQAGKHLRSLARLFLVQPELRHIIADLSYILADVVDATAGKAIDDARGHLGQTQSTTGTFQRVAQKALAQMQAEKAERSPDAAGSTMSDGVASQIVGFAQPSALSETANGAATTSAPSMSLLREQLAAVVKTGDLSLASIRAELANGKTVPALEELRRQAQLVATTVAQSQSELEQMRARISEGEIPPRVLEKLLPPNNELKATANDTSGGTEQSILNRINTSLQAADLADALQMLAVANKQLHLKPNKETIQQMTRKARQDAQAKLESAFNEEVQQRLLNRTKKLIDDCQKSRGYQEAFLWLIGRIETLFSTVQKNAELPGTSLDSALSLAAEPLIELLENFADGRKLRPLLELMRELSFGAKDDETIQAFWQDADKHLRQCLLEEGFVFTPSADEGFRRLARRFQQLSAAYKDKFAQLITGAAAFVNAIRQDTLVLKLFKALQAVLRDVGKEGWKKSSLWHDLRSHILPSIIEKIGTIPVPRVKYLHPDFDLVIENIALDLQSLLPDTFDVRMTNDVHLDFRKISDSAHAHSFKIKIKGMSLRVHKLAFAVTSRLLFPFHDKGIADLNVRDFGVSIFIDVPKDTGPHYFVVRNVKAKLGVLQLKVQESNHRILHSFANQLANSYLTKRILRHFIAQGITLGLKQLDLALVARKLNKDTEAGNVTLQEMKQQMAELRDLLRKYHEQAGTLEIDFTRPDTGESMGKLGAKATAEAVGNVFEESHAVRWVKRQVDDTARVEIKRNRWRSNAFDLAGMQSSWPAEEETDEAKHAVHANAQMKPEGSTDQHVVNNAEKELRDAKEDIEKERKAVQSPVGMDSALGKDAVASSQHRSKQTKVLESNVEQHLS